MIDDPSQLAYMIDQTLLKPEATKIEYEDFIQRNANTGFHTLFIPPSYLKLAVRLLSRSKTFAGGIVGFPFGWDTKKEKILQMNRALLDGADEVDFVMNISMLKSGDKDYVMEEFRALKEEASKHKNKFGEKIILKCIIECCLLTDDEKRTAVELLVKEKIDYVKTSTGFSMWGAKVEDVQILAETGKGAIKVKASGGIRTAEEAMAMIAAGASRIGTSAGSDIVAELSFNEEALQE